MTLLSLSSTPSALAAPVASFLSVMAVKVVVPSDTLSPSPITIFPAAAPVPICTSAPAASFHFLSVSL